MVRTYPPNAVRFGLTCTSCGVTQTFDTERERDTYAEVHPDCDVDRFRLLTR